jgi:hypothetical protein
MTIGTNDAIRKFGTQDTVSAGGGTSAVASAAYSVAGDAAAWTNDDDTDQAAAVLTFQYPSGTITTGGVQLLCRLLDIDGTTDEPPLTTNWQGHYLGSFPTGTGMAATTDYAIQSGPFLLPAAKASQIYEFYVRNSCGVTMTAGWTLKITPVADGPHA